MTLVGSSRPAVADVCGQRRMQDLDGLKPERLDPVEDPLAGAEQDRRNVERELVNDPGNEGLAHSRGATRDVYAALAGRLTRLCVSVVEAAGDEVEGCPTFHLDRLVSVMGQHKHRRVVRRLGTPPAAPVLVPLAADRPEHVPPHDVRAARAHEPAGRRRVGVVGALVAEMPGMELAPTLAEWILAALVGPGDEAVQRDRHVAGRVRHRRQRSRTRRISSFEITDCAVATPAFTRSRDNRSATANALDSSRRSSRPRWRPSRVCDTQTLARWWTRFASRRSSSGFRSNGPT